MLIEATTGEENFPVGTAKFHLIFQPSRQFPGTAKHISQVVKEQGAQLRQLSTNVVMAAQGVGNKLGIWYQGRFDVPEGAVFTVFGSRTSSQFGAMSIRANYLIRMREGAAFHRIAAILTGWDRATFSRVNIEGRFDLITTEAEAAALGVEIPAFQRQWYFNDSFHRRMFEVTQLSPETAAPAIVEERKVTNTSGEEVTITEERNRRALDL